MQAEMPHFIDYLDHKISLVRSRTLTPPQRQDLTLSAFSAKFVFIRLCAKKVSAGNNYDFFSPQQTSPPGQVFFLYRLFSHNNKN